MKMTNSIPATLNGSPVIAVMPMMSDDGVIHAYIVVVKRNVEAPQPQYVVARWSDLCGDEWTDGSYVKTWDVAKARMMERAS